MTRTACAVAADSACGCNGGCSDGSCDGVCFSPDACCCGGGAYAYYEFVWIRPHVNEDWVGKLSEEFKLSNRIVLGYENCCGWGGRARYWQYDHSITILDPAEMAMSLDVVDLEVTSRVGFRSTDILFGGGLRYVNWTIADGDGTPVDLQDAVGLTLAADARTPLCTYCNNRWSFVYGARWSILGGDWHGDNDVIDTIGGTNIVRDDNLLVTELYSGVEYMFCWNGCTMFSRATAEMQNWRSDVLAEPGIGNGIAPLSVGSTASSRIRRCRRHVWLPVLASNGLTAQTITKRNEPRPRNGAWLFSLTTICGGTHFPTRLAVLKSVSTPALDLHSGVASLAAVSWRACS